MERKTIKEKVISGTVQKCRIKKQLNFEPLREIPAPMDKLGPVGLEFYGYVCEILMNNNMLTTGDIIPITDAAFWWELSCMSKQEIRTNGYFQISPNGFTSKTAAFQVLTDASKALSAFYKSYGLNFAVRSKLDMPKPEKKNEFDDI